LFRYNPRVLAVTLQEQLNAFRASAPIHSLRHDGVEWTYRAVGSGTHGLLLLPGAVGSGEAFFTLTPFLVDTHRLLAIAYPQVDSLARLLDGLRAILDREGLESTDMVGGSFGGLVAQAFLRRFPQRTRRIVLSASGPARVERAASNAKWSRRVGRLPIGVSRALLRAIVRGSLKKVTAERGFWRGFYRRAIDAVSRDDLVARYALSADIDRHGPPSLAAVPEWRGAIMILEGDADRISRGSSRQALRSLFPDAQLKTFAGAGHAISIERRDQWTAAVTGFLRS
jgi:pimeloyl-ACP methyl ester carboxylesterase